MRTSSVARSPVLRRLSSEQGPYPTLVGNRDWFAHGLPGRPYAFGLAMALVSKGVGVDMIGSDEMDSPELHTTPNLRFLNFRGSQQENMQVSRRSCRSWRSTTRRLMRYAARSKPEYLHILWNNKFELFDRTLLMLYYKLCGKKDRLHSSQRQSSPARRERFAAQSHHAQNSVPALRSHIRPHQENEERTLPGFWRGRKGGHRDPASGQQRFPGH